ncbi:MAG: zinc-ribbon domain-containing protein, partial [Gemmatimonadaceae bacterium]
MNVTCPECRSVFRVDPGRIPGASVRARCAVCGGVITVSRDGAAAPPAARTTPAFASRTPSAAPATPGASGLHFGSAPTPPLAQPATQP